MSIDRSLALAEHILALETDPYLQGHPEWEAFLNEAAALVRNAKAEPKHDQQPNLNDSEDQHMTPTNWPKFRMRPCASGAPVQIITEGQALRAGFDERSIQWLKSRQVAGTYSNKQDYLTLYTQNDSIRDAAPELLQQLEALCVQIQHAGLLIPPGVEAAIRHAKGE